MKMSVSVTSKSYGAIKLAYADVAGVAYRAADGTLRRTPPASPIHDLDALPFVTDVYARDLDYNLVIASDACTSPERDNHDQLVKRIFPRMARVRTAAQVAAMLEARA